MNMQGANHNHLLYPKHLDVLMLCHYHCDALSQSLFFFFFFFSFFFSSFLGIILIIKYKSKFRCHGILANAKQV